MAAFRTAAARIFRSCVTVPNASPIPGEAPVEIGLFQLSSHELGILAESAPPPRRHGLSHVKDARAAAWMTYAARANFAQFGTKVQPMGGRGPAKREDAVAGWGEP